MNCKLVAYNHHIINKMLWMSRQLRNCNDNVTVCNWAHAMSMLKSLLLPSSPYHHNIIPQQQPSLATITHPSNRSITPPATISFQPAKKKSLIQSPPRCSIFEPIKPSALTTYTHCLTNIPPTDSLPQRAKKRKLIIPPSVDYSVSTELPLPTCTSPAPAPSLTIPPSVDCSASTEFPLPTCTLPVVAPALTTPGLGSHIWYWQDPTTLEHWCWNRNMPESLKMPEAEEFEVVKTPNDFDSNYTLVSLETGKDSVMNFPKDVAEVLFKT